MISFINTWAQRIIVVVIICTIIEMVLPEGNNKKYVKTIDGIYVVFTIVGPIISKINRKESLNLEKYLNYYNNNNVIETSLVIDNNKYVEELYKERICTDIKTKIHALGYNVKTIDIEIEENDEESYGSILKLYLKIDKNQEDEYKENIIYIEPVIIDKEKNIEEKEINDDEVEEIKEYLKTTYFIDEKIIKIE